MQDLRIRIAEGLDRVHHRITGDPDLHIRITEVEDLRIRITEVRGRTDFKIAEDPDLHIRTTGVPDLLIRQDKPAEDLPREEIADRVNFPGLPEEETSRLNQEDPDISRQTDADRHPELQDSIRDLLRMK